MLPPGPSEPAAVQTVGWIARPTDLLRRCAARYGEPFTLRTLWADGPMVIVSDPATIKRVYAAPAGVLDGGASSTVLEPFVGTSSILLARGGDHLRRRKLMLPPFHGERLEAHRATVVALAEAEVASWASGRALRTLPRMQSLTLDVILRVVLGAPDPRLRAELRAALDMTTSLSRLVALSLAPRGSAWWRPFLRAVARVDVLLRAAIRRRRPGNAAVLDELIADGATEDELRDQVVTLLAAGHETTAASLAWALERLARHPHVVARLREDDDAYLDATVQEVLRVRPVLSITPRKVVEPFRVGEWTLPPGVHVTPCPYLVHRRAELWPDPTAFRPERFLERAPAPFTWLPFGGGLRRCIGAAFATMELREVLRVVVRRWELRPDRPEGERMRRRGVTLTPARGGRVVCRPLPPRDSASRKGSAPLVVVDAPIDCSGAGRGEERAPAALRAAGLIERLGARDAGEAGARIRDTRRDPGTGVIGARDVRRASAAIAARVRERLEARERTLVVGGDCTLLLGVFQALPRGSGLWFVDGHADFFDGESSPTGEAADMELAILTGHGPAGLLELDESLLDPAAVVLLGHRPAELHPDVARENARLDPAIHAVDAREVRERGAVRVGTHAAARLADRPAWLHLDLDVLDGAVLPAVTYPQPLGLDWDELLALVRPLAGAPNLLGASVADFNPDRDPDGIHAARVVEALGALWGAEQGCSSVSRLA